MDEKKTVIRKSADLARLYLDKTENFCRILFGKDLRDEKERLDSKKWRKQLLFSTLIAGITLLFSLVVLPFGASSLGYAFFAASVGIHALYATAGLLLSLFFTKSPLVTLFVTALGLLMRILIKRTSHRAAYFEESRRTRIALALSLGFLDSFAASALVGFTQDSLIALLAASLVAPLTALLFTLITTPVKEGAWRELGRLTIVFFLVYALDTVGVFGLSLGVMLAFFLTLSIAITNGALRGVLMGLVAGLALGGVYAPILAVAGLCTGLASNLSLTYSVLASAALAIVMNLYLKGPVNALAFSGDILITALLFLPLAKAGLIPQIHFFTDEPSELPGMKYVEGVQKKYRQSKLEALSGSFEELSDVFLELSEKSRRPGSYELQEAGDEVLSRYCHKCALHHICWQRDADEMNDAMHTLYKKVQEGSPALPTDLPEAFAGRCRHLEKILRDINNAARDLVERAIRRDKTELFALDYEAMAELLAEAAREGDDEFERDLVLCKKASATLRANGVVALGYSAWGKRQKTVLASGVDVASLSKSSQALATSLSDATGLAFSEPHFDFSGDFVTMTVETLPKLSLEIGTASRAKEEGAVSGDALTAFEDARGNPYCLLCDGMGSGKAAAITARISTVFLEKMIAAGNKKTVVLKMLSNFLRSKSEECHSTADLLEIDTYSCRAIFLKCGAAPSYLCHEDNLVRIDLHSLPIGITREFSPAIESLPISAGDTLVLASDGVAFEEAKLLSLIKERENDPASTLADAILDTFSSNDDASTIVIRITAH